MSLNFNDAERQDDLIPSGTVARVMLKIRAGGYDDPTGQWPRGFTTRGKTGAVWLDCEYVILAGPYAKRRVWGKIGLHSPKGDAWRNMGRKFMRAMLESARGIMPKDMSPEAVQARTIGDLTDLNGLEFVARIDIEEGAAGYDDKNTIQAAVTPNQKAYAEAMGEGSTPNGAATPSGASTSSAPASAPGWLD